jgi:predicted kinase
VPKLTMTFGLPASGKSTWAKEQVRESNGKIKRVNKDDMRDMIDAGLWSLPNESHILAIRDAVIINSLLAGFSVIVDDTNLEPKHEKRLRELAANGNAEFEIKDFSHVSLAECIKRDLKRDKSVGKGVITSMFNKYFSTAEQPTIEQYNPDSELPWCIIVDIDGTLAHMNGRSPYDWERVGEDAIDRAVLDILNTYSWTSPLLANRMQTDIIIISGRKLLARTETKKWLKKYDVPYKALYMRPEDAVDENGKDLKDTVVKRALFDKYIRDKYQVLFVLDDRQVVVDQWRAMGLKCLQVQPGDF